jgi:hypothetical protein
MKKIVTCLFYSFISLTSLAQAYETIHFHFDKDVYLPGETIWYKAYLYNNTKPAVTSTNLYTAIYDAAGKLLQQKQYPIFESVANGEFTLPDTLGNGTLIFRAFTKTMLLQDSVNVYQQLITIAGSSTMGTTLQTAIATSAVNFYPEGGQLVAGVQNYLGIAARFTDGTAFTAKGILKANTTEISSFETDANGLALVQFIPEANTGYYAEWTDENGSLQKASLPSVKTYGAALHTEVAGNSLFYMVNKNINAANFATLHLVAQQGASAVYRAELVMNDVMKAVNNFRTDSLATGLLTVSLFDKEWNLLAQRTVFVNSAEPPLKVNISRLSTNEQPRGKNIIEIEVTDSTATNLSVSVADADFYKENALQIEEALLLGNKQPGVISLPLPGDSIKKKQTDLFTLTRQWPLVASDTSIKKTVPADNYLDLSFSSKKYFSAKEELTVIINDKISKKQFLSIPPAGSSFAKSGLVFYDSAKIYYQLLKNKDAVDEVKPGNANILQSPASIAPPAIFTRAVKKQAAAKGSVYTNFVKAKPATFNAVQTLRTVTVKSRYTNPETIRQLELEEKYASGPFKGLARGVILTVMDDPDAEAIPDIYSYISYRAGLATRSTFSGGKTFGEIPIFIDEVESPNEVLQALPISQIAYVKYIRGIVVSLRFTSIVGVLYVYTKKGDEPLPPPKNMRTTFVKGYNSHKLFTQPDYEDPNNGVKTDNRSTLYWNPYVITDATNRKFTIEYYNNDLSKKLLLVIEGMDENGRLVHIKKLIEQ